MADINDEKKENIEDMNPKESYGQDDSEQGKNSDNHAEIKEKPKEDREHSPEKSEKKEQSHKHKKHRSSKRLLTEIKFLPKLRENPWIASTFILAILVIYFLFFSSSAGNNQLMQGKVISAEDAGNKVLELAKMSINSDNISLNSVTEKSGLYEVSLSVDGRELPVYITPDGENLVNGIISIETLEERLKTNKQSQNNQKTEEIPKTSKPKIELFVMSFCPFGNKAEDTMLPVYNLLKNVTDFEVHYIASSSGDTLRSLHGQKEVDEDIRELCVLNRTGKDKFWEFITYINSHCGYDGSCWENATAELGIDTNEIKDCIENQGKEMLKKEAVLSNERGVSGSPTLFINGVKTNEVYKYGNSEAYKNSICSGFLNSSLPAECSTALSASTSTSSGGSCG